MGKQNPMGITGKVGNTIHYKMGDHYYTRSMPGKFKQSTATKAMASEFGRASGIGATIRKLLLPVIPEPKDRKMQGRLVAVVFNWLQSFAPNQPIELKDLIGNMDQFQFTRTGAPIQTRWKVLLQIRNNANGEIDIYIPEFIPKKAIQAPLHTVSVIFKIAIGSCDVKTGLELGKCSDEFTFDFDSKPLAARTISTKIHTPEESLLVTGIALEFICMIKGYKRTIRNKIYIPSGIVNAKYFQ